MASEELPEMEPRLQRQLTHQAEEPPKVYNGPGCLMIGTGEYTTGFVGGTASDSDKGAGVVGLVMFDLRKHGKVGRLAMCGTNGGKFPAIREHLQKKIGDVYKDLDISFDSFPTTNEFQPKAYLEAIETFQPGDCVTIFTPDDTHFEIALACVRRGLHVLVTKPIVKTLREHELLLAEAKKANVLVMVEVHKRYDPIYVDARDRIQELGGLSYMYSYMSQPKHQLQTFKAWAGKSSDISYYLNSHHIDFCEWANLGRSKPLFVTAVGSWGVAQSQGLETEDAITLTVQWLNSDGTRGHSVHTSSWCAPKADVHSQQRFFYMGSKGEVTVDQGHRGYTVAEDGQLFKSVNPLFFKYTPSNGQFSGQNCYGYVSFAKFIDAATQINNKTAVPADFDQTLPTVGTTMLTTAILEAGRLSLDNKGATMKIIYSEDGPHSPPVDIVRADS